MIRAMAVLSLLILAYCLTSALNARATYHPEAWSFEYHDCLPWLPHSLDSSRTWFTAWSYLALTCSFWAIRDWLLGKSATEQKAGLSKTESATGQRSSLPERLRWLLCLLALNGLLLGVEGMAQRLEGSGKLLFLVQPRVNPGALSQFGPWAYRANAASYFNLLWPVCVGFWWTLQRTHRTGKLHHLLLLCAAVMAAGSVMSTSRGGALVAGGMLVVGTGVLVVTHFVFGARPKESPGRRILAIGLLLGFACVAVGLGYALGWKQLEPRLADLQENFEAREAMFDTARPMARDYPVFGTGPGTFRTVFQLYRISPETYWPAQLHNDWLETRITFGWAGTALIALAFLALLARYFARGGIYGGRRFTIMIWLALAGCLVHARFDFPFQIYSILFLFLVICAILSTLSLKPA